MTGQCRYLVALIFHPPPIGKNCNPMPLLRSPHCHPEGMIENSPTFQRRDPREQEPSPEGTAGTPPSPIGWERAGVRVSVCEGYCLDRIVQYDLNRKPLTRTLSPRRGEGIRWPRPKHMPWGCLAVC